MKPKHLILCASAVLFAISAAVFAGGEKAMADTVLYRANLKSNKNRVVTLKKRGEGLIITLEGFADKPLELKATDGGTSTCRTTIEHNSAQTTVLLSLGMPDTRARCSMSSSFISVEGNNVSIEEETLKKIAGSDATIRNTVQKILGKIEQEEG